MYASQSPLLFAEFHLYVWNITFTKVNHVSGLPPCYHEFLAVQKGHGLKGFIYGNKNTKGHNVINNYQFCGVRSQLHLYPEDLNVEVIYENNKVITDSEFAFQFQVMDHGLVESLATGIIIEEMKYCDPQKLLLASTTLAVITYHILVNKLSEIRLIITPGKQKYNIYSGPIIHEQFWVKHFQGSMTIPSFQCIAVVYTENVSLEDEMNFTEVRHNLPVYNIKLEKDKEYMATYMACAIVPLEHIVQ